MIPSDIDLPHLTLDTVAGGALPELFAAELKRVLENILDPSTSPEAKRSIRIDITIEPNEARNACAVSVAASSKIAGFKAAGGVMFVGRRRGVAVALVNNMEQTQLDWDAADAPKALPVAPSSPASATGS